MGFLLLVIVGLAGVWWAITTLAARWGHGWLCVKQVARPAFRAKRIAHRGGRETTPENTLDSFRNALAVGTDMLELDVWLTADGTVVVLHDGDLLRVTGHAGHVTELKYSELPKVHRLPSDGYKQGERSTGGKESIPTLAEVLSLLEERQECVLVEVKQDSAELVCKVAELLYRSTVLREGRVLWFSLKAKINNRLRLADPGIPTISAVDEVLKAIVLWYSGLLPFCKAEFHAFGFKLDRVNPDLVLLALPILRPLPNSVLRGIGNWVSGLLRSRMLNDHFRARGIPVLVIGVNDAEALAEADRLGATAVLSDRPEWLAKQFEAGEHLLETE